jgi:hypothetical protein
MMIEDRLSAAMDACREALAPSPDFFARLEERARRVDRWRRVRLVVASIAAAALIGAGAVALVDHRDRSADVSSTRRDFVTQANGVCARAVQQVQAGSPSLPASTEEFAAAARRTSIIDQTAIGALRSLKPPAAAIATVRAMLTQLDLALGAAKVYGAVKYAKGGPTSSTPQSMAALAAASNAIADAAGLAHEYGVDRCADMIYTALYAL